jgi:hypothetical protein
LEHQSYFVANMSDSIQSCVILFQLSQKLCELSHDVHAILKLDTVENPQLHKDKSEHFVPCYLWPAHGAQLTALGENINSVLMDEICDDINRTKMAQDGI